MCSISNANSLGTGASEKVASNVKASAFLLAGTLLYLIVYSYEASVSAHPCICADAMQGIGVDSLRRLCRGLLSSAKGIIPAKQVNIKLLYSKC